MSPGSSVLWIYGDQMSQGACVQRSHVRGPVSGGPASGGQVRSSQFPEPSEVSKSCNT